jgi:aldehyde:ferredoxin oxidoreductase
VYADTIAAVDPVPPELRCGGSLVNKAMLEEQSARVLHIDLDRKKFRVEVRADLFRDYLGGVGLASALLSENVIPDGDPLDPHQPAVMAIGPMNFVFPMVTKVAAMFKSPLTGNLGESYAGMRLGMTLRLAGYDALVIKGRSSVPVFLNITSRDVEFMPARPLWGMDCETAGQYLRTMVKGAGKRSIMRIGPAGENLVRFACVNVDNYRHFGRLGLGALFGSKNLKAIVVSSDRDFAIPEPKLYREVYEDLYNRITGTDTAEKYHDLGTPENVLPLNAFGGLPTMNMRAASFDGAKSISGESFAEEVLTRKVSCSGCPIGCIHLALLRTQFGTSHEFKSREVNYDYEPLFAVGSMLGLSDKQTILSIIEKTEYLGLDVMTAGVILSWIAEGLERGALTTEMTEGTIAFGKAGDYDALLTNLACPSNDFYRALASDPQKAAEGLGLGDCFMAVQGNGMTGYHTGYGSLLGQIVGMRHSHLDNGGYSLDQKEKDLSDEALLEKIIKEEQARQMQQSLIICLFARKIYDPATAARCLSTLGITRTEKDLEDLGKRIYRLKADLKKSFGYDFSAVRVPSRFFETPSGRGILDPGRVSRLAALHAEKLGSI